MVEQQKPWTWTDDRTVVLRTDKGSLEFKLLPVDPKKVSRFRNELSLANDVRVSLARGLQAFQTGQAEYTNAARRLKKLNLELGKALEEQLAVAQGVGLFFAPGGVEKEFENDVAAITDFSVETIEHLFKMEIEAKKAPAKEPASEPMPVVAASEAEPEAYPAPSEPAQA